MLLDSELAQEIVLLTELIIAATRSTGPLTPHEIDEILGAPLDPWPVVWDRY
jgi:hypothetical protein